MAYTKLIIMLAIIATVTPIVSATEHIVGDESGWTGNYDYEAWANSKTFYVGDTLVFKYKLGSHTVFKVNATGFQDCNIPPLTEAKASGNDVFTLTSSGKKWYICGMVPNHCATLGMKLAITVSDQQTAPVKSPTKSSTPTTLVSWFQVFTTTLVAAVAMAIA